LQATSGDYFETENAATGILNKKILSSSDKEKCEKCFIIAQI
jgi:hypothetical protein